MTQRMIGSLLGLVLGLTVVSASLAADFSAEVYSGTPGGKGVTKSGKVFVTAKKVRIDAGVQGRQMSTIMRLDKRVIWMLDPSKKQYVEMPVKDPKLADPASDAALLQRCSKKSLGTETIGGFKCDKAQYTDKAGEGVKIIRWFSKKLNWPMKTQITMPGGKQMTQEVKNVKMGKQAASLFDLPKGYKKQQMPPPGGAPAPSGKKPK